VLLCLETADTNQGGCYSVTGLSLVICGTNNRHAVISKVIIVERGFEQKALACSNDVVHTFHMHSIPMLHACFPRQHRISLGCLLILLQGSNRLMAQMHQHINLSDSLSHWYHSGIRLCGAACWQILSYSTEEGRLIITESLIDNQW